VYFKKKDSENNQKMKEIILNYQKSLEKRKQIISSTIQKSEKALKKFKYTKDAEIVQFRKLMIY